MIVMKTSNYILISFAVFLLGLTFLLFLSSKHHTWEVVKEDLVLHEEYLDSYSVVVVRNHSSVQIDSDDENRIVRYTKSTDTFNEGAGYTVRNDTLFINKVEKYIVRPHLYCSSLESLVVRDYSSVNMSFSDMDSIEVSVLTGNFHGFAENENDKLDYVKFSAFNNSNVNLTNVSIDYLSLNVDGCKMNINRTTMKKLKGSLKNGAELYGYKTSLSKIDLETDMSSRYSLYK